MSDLVIRGGRLVDPVAGFPPCIEGVKVRLRGTLQLAPRRCRRCQQTSGQHEDPSQAVASREHRERICRNAWRSLRASRKRLATSRSRSTVNRPDHWNRRASRPWNCSAILARLLVHRQRRALTS